MTKIHTITVLASLLILLTFINTVSACTCVSDSLSKRFKSANAVFIARLADEVPQDKQKIQNYADGRITLEVKKSWKGVRKDHIAIQIGKLPETSGNCPMLMYFENNTEYLVFAYGDGLEVHVECSDTRPLTEKHDYTTKEIAKLDSFWFRFRSKIRLF